MCSNAFSLSKSSNEGHTGSIYLNEEENKCMPINTHKETVNQSIDFLQYKENQSCKETPNEKSALQQDFNNTEYCSQVQIFQHEKIHDFNLNKPSTSFRARQISENIPQTSSIPPSVSRGFSSFQSYNSESSPCHNKNQQTSSTKYNPMDYCDIGMNQKCEANDPVVKNAHDDKQEYKSSSPSRMGVKNINLNLEKYSKRYRRNLDSFARSKVANEDNEGISQKNAILEKECGRDGQRHHEYRAHNEQDLTHENTNDFLMCQNVNDMFQISDEIQLGNLSGIEEQRNYMVIDLCKENERLALDIPDYNENQLHYETPNESGTLLPHCTNFNNYSRVRLPTYQEYLEHKLNEHSTSSSESGAWLPHRTNFNNYSRVRLPTYQEYLEHKLNEHSTYSGIRNRSEDSAQINTHFSVVSAEFNVQQLIDLEVNLFNKNRPSVLDKCSTTGYCYSRINAQFSENVVVVAKNSHFVSSLNRVYEEPKHEDGDCTGEGDANVILKSNSGRNARNEVPSSNSSNICSTHAEISFDFQCPGCKVVFPEVKAYAYPRLGFCEKFILNVPSTFWGVSQLRKNSKQNSSRPPSVSPEFNLFQSTIPHVKSSLNRNQLSVSAERSQMKCNSIEMNPQVKTNELENSNSLRMRADAGQMFNVCDADSRLNNTPEWAQNDIAVVPDFHKRILCRDEASFWLNGYVNKQNYHIWSEAIPHVYVETPLHPEKVTVWCALWAGGFIGPYFFKNDEGHNVTVNGDRYRAMITNFFIPELNNHDVQELWFQQDGATGHTARATIDLLKNTLGGRLISRF
ncbi:uncharacterized protein TNCV_5035591 [Trichonephila clavipes]|nr:uncharacterized protein TNCV_5035591 [Trichonephila clavipes]